MTTTDIILTALFVIGQFVVVAWLFNAHVLRPRREYAAARKAYNFKYADSVIDSWYDNCEYEQISRDW